MIKKKSDNRLNVFVSKNERSFRHHKDMVLLVDPRIKFISGQFIASSTQSQDLLNTMELLTYRLSTLVSQVAENRMAELIKREKLQKQRLIEQVKREKMKKYQAKIQAKNEKRPISSNKRKDGQKFSPNREGITNKQVRPKDANMATVGMFLNLPKNSKEGMDEGKDLGENLKAPSGVEDPFNRFRKIARKTALINALKQGRDICTCSSLDAICKVHDG